MKRRRLRLEDYTLGWVCALPVELAAAEKMLDEEHEDLLQDAYETNIYTLGRIADHNVIISCLPAGQIGTNSAAAYAVHMMAKFKSIRFGLMVGVGGGVPTAENDIRLGDVVISQPPEGHGGVIQYDFGKSTASGFVRTGYLNAPPKILLNALARLRANYMSGKSNFLRHMRVFDDLKQFSQNEAGPDILFDADYHHYGRFSCDTCDSDRIVRRKPRISDESVLHYGTIASGNHVIKNSGVRDQLSSELGGVLCFEMEAAGLMNDFSCLVIRGICDYCDSHKNKDWQPYAAATAAACAKEILSVIPSAYTKEISSPMPSAGGFPTHGDEKAAIYVCWPKGRRNRGIHIHNVIC
jgi:nucleoside phosphorylase